MLPDVNKENFTCINFRLTAQNNFGISSRNSTIWVWTVLGSEWCKFCEELPIGGCVRVQQVIAWVKTNTFIKNYPALELCLRTKEKDGGAIKPCCSLDLRQVESFQEQPHEQVLPFLDLQNQKLLLKTHHLQHPLHFYIKAVKVFINCRD